MNYYSTTTNGTSATDRSYGFGGATFYIRIGRRYRPPPPVVQRPTVHPCPMLGVPCGAPLGQVTIAYRRLAKAHHPDLGTEEERATRTKRMAEINHAYDLLLAKHGKGR